MKLLLAVLIIFVIGACGSHSPTAPSSQESTIVFGGFPTLCYSNRYTSLRLPVLDAGDTGISRLNYAAWHSESAGCGPVYSGAQPEGITMTDEMSYRPHSQGFTTFYWRAPTCGRVWVVVTAVVSPTLEIVVTSFAINSEVDCPG